MQHARATRCHGGCRSKFETDLENQENLENLFFFNGFGLPRPGGRSKFETDLENLENLENQFCHGFGLLSVSLARDRSQWSLTCKFPVPLALALVWGPYIPHGDGQHTFSQTFEQTKSTRHAQ